VARAGKPDDRPQPAPIGVCEAGARAADPIDLSQRKSPIDIDRNLSSAIRPASAALASASVFARTLKLTPL